MRSKRRQDRLGRLARRGRAGTEVGFEQLEPRCLLSSCPSMDASAGEYTVRTAYDQTTGNCEYRFLTDRDQHHFGTLIRTPEQKLAFRPHPSPYDLDGWGMTIFPAPYVAGVESDSGGLTTLDVTPLASGIQIQATGSVNREGGTAGSWTLAGEIAYVSASQEVAGTITQTISLDHPLSTFTGDLNVFRLNTNYLEDVLLDDGSFGNTGDTAGVHWSLGPQGTAYTDVFVPTTANPATFPQDETTDLNILIKGEVNQAAGDGPAVKRTPDFSISTECLPPATPMIFGAFWDPARNFFYADNFGITPVVLHQDQQAWVMSFRSVFSSAPATATQWAADHPWQNAFIWQDVDGNGTVAPLDALTLINYLNLGNIGPLPVPPPSPDHPPPYVDVYGDNLALPLDVLTVVNTLNRDVAGNAGGEGEAALPRSWNGTFPPAAGEAGTVPGIPDQSRLSLHERPHVREAKGDGTAIWFLDGRLTPAAAPAPVQRLAGPSLACAARRDAYFEAVMQGMSTEDRIGVSDLDLDSVIPEIRCLDI